MIDSFLKRGRLLFSGLTVVAAFFLIRGLFSSPEAYWKGCPAPNEPDQRDCSGDQPVKLGKFLIEPLACYRIKAVVLSRKSYRGGAGAELSPLDLALGWREMAEARVINRLKFSQSNRWYRYRWKGEEPIPLETIISHSANVHCIPANNKVRKALKAIKRHMLVELEGYLVAVSGPEGFFWKSSLTRQDSGDGSCELFYILKVRALKIKH